MRNVLLKLVSPFRLAVLGKLNNFVKEWIAEISELKVGRLFNKTSNVCVIYRTLKPLSSMSRMRGGGGVGGGGSNQTYCLVSASPTEPATLGYMLCWGQDIYIWVIQTWSPHKRYDQFITPN